MRFVPKVVAKVIATVALSACMISSFVIPAFAEIDASSLTNQVSNVLPAEFNVTSEPVGDPVILSWDFDGIEQGLETFNVKQSENQKVTYYVSKGELNGENLTVSILLKMPNSSVVAVDTIEFDEDELELAFEKEGFTYYLLNSQLDIHTLSNAYSDVFKIKFNQTSAPGSPFTASLIAVDAVQGLKKAPNLSFEGFNYSDGNIEYIRVGISEQSEDWIESITGFFYSYDDGKTYTETVVELSEGEVKFSGGAVPDISYKVTYKIEADGYEDAKITIVPELN